MGLDELEALRLCDRDGLDQSAAAERMGVSQPTVHRILASARSKAADALVSGKALTIGGGNFMFCGGRRRRCHDRDDEAGDSQR